jgi:hypothetical protein
MARNRRSESVAIRFGPALKAFLLCLLIGGSGVGYVWQKEQLSHLGQQIKMREKHLLKLEDQNEKLRKQLGFMRSPGFLEERIKTWKLGLVLPLPSQVWRLTEPSAESVPAETGHQFVAQSERVPVFQ